MLPDATSRDWLTEYATVRRHTEALAAPLSPEDQTVQTMADVSPTKWHRAHVTWFFETFVLGDHIEGYKPYADGYWTLFNSYYEAKGPRHPRPERGFITRPGAGEVGDYRSDIDKRMLEFLSGLDEAAIESLAPLMELGFHHEQQHQELLLMDIKHVMSCNPLRPAAYASGEHHVRAREDAGSRDWVVFEGGLSEVGAAGEGFTFDNELPRHPAYVPAFRIDRDLVTNRQWLEFMADGGYARHEFWLSDGWARVKAEGWQAPMYWIEQDGQWWQHTLSGTRPLDLDEPVIHVSHYEADAYASWAGARLPTEFEWELAADHGALRNVDDSCWQWTSSAYLPYPGFRAAAGAVGEYNGKFMSNQMVLRGGACITPAGHTRTTYRNFYPPHSRWAFSGVRLAADA